MPKEETLAIRKARSVSKWTNPLCGVHRWERWSREGSLKSIKAEEYEKLKKTQPSHADTYELLGFNDTVKEDFGIVVYVKRLSDKMKFTLPLADLKATDEQSNNYQLLDDFSAWFVNYR